MAQISVYPFVSRLRTDTSSFVQLYRNGVQVQAGRGLTFWFQQDGASITEMPVDDRQTQFVIKGPSADFQEITVQGAVMWRIVDPKALGDRVDFSIDLRSGVILGQPIQQINSTLIGLVRQFTYAYLQKYGVRDLLKSGVAPLQSVIADGFGGAEALTSMGLGIERVGVSDISPTSELAKALKAPTFESLQQKADEASFARRAQAVEKERAIAENELNNQIELASRQKELIDRESANARLRAEAEAAMLTMRADAEAHSIRTVDQAKAEMENARMDVLSTVPPTVLFAMAAQEFAGKVNTIDSITVTPDMLSGLANQLGGIFGKLSQTGSAGQ